MSIALIIAGGTGSRTGQAIPKQFLTVKDKPILIYTLEKFEKCPYVQQIYVAVDCKYAAITWDYIKQFRVTKVKELIQSGSTRNKSICNALEKIKQRHRKDEIIVIHHANMPFITEGEIQSVIEKTNVGNFVFAVAEQYDYMLKTEKGIRLIEREGIMQIRVPEAMSLDNASKIYEGNLRDEESKSSPFIFMKDGDLASKLTFDVVKCSNLNFKITTFEDFEMAKAIILSGEN